MRKPKYEPLKKYLEKSKNKKEKLTYDEIEKIIGGELPNSAYKYSTFWSNGGQYQDYAWLEAGWFVKKTVIPKYVVFEKIDEYNKNQQLTFIEDLKNEKPNKYEPFKKYLKNSQKDKIILTYEDIEEIINDKLPESSYKYKEWWSNSKHNRGGIWLEIQYKVENVNLGENVEFVKIKEKTSIVAKIIGKLKKFLKI